MSTLKLNQVTDAETAESRWNWLYKVGGSAALLAAVIIPIAIIVYIVSPQPQSVLGHSPDREHKDPRPPQLRGNPI